MAVVFAGGGKDASRHWAGDRGRGQLEGDGAGVAHDAGTDPDQLALQAGQGPTGQHPGQSDEARESSGVLGGCRGGRPARGVATGPPGPCYH